MPIFVSRSYASSIRLTPPIVTIFFKLFNDCHPRDPQPPLNFSFFSKPGLWISIWCLGTAVQCININVWKTESWKNGTTSWGEEAGWSIDSLYFPFKTNLKWKNKANQNHHGNSLSLVLLSLLMNYSCLCFVLWSMSDGLLGGPSNTPKQDQRMINSTNISMGNITIFVYLLWLHGGSRCIYIYTYMYKYRYYIDRYVYIYILLFVLYVIFINYDISFIVYVIYIYVCL